MKEKKINYVTNLTSGHAEYDVKNVRDSFIIETTLFTLDLWSFDVNFKDLRESVH